MTIFSILLGKLLIFFVRIFNLGNGSTWPGHIALALDKNFLKKMPVGNMRIILIAGTNGKTTTGKMLATILEKNGKRVFQNSSGANLLNGIASSFIANISLSGIMNFDCAIFEVDENTLPLVLKEITPFSIIILNLFRDQLDRYGELDTIAKSWKKPLQQLPKESIVVLNADDSLIGFLGKGLKAKTLFFGLQEPGNPTNYLSHASDSIYCPNCGAKLTFDKIYYSHLGIWHCKSCKLSRPKLDLSEAFYPLIGEYNKYNTLAATLLALELGFSKEQIGSALKDFNPAFGRQEKISFGGKSAQIFLSKNPTGFNQNLQTVKSLSAKTILIVLNDGIADGQDVSWIWDIDLELFMGSVKTIILSGDRVYDMGLRFDYAKSKKSQSAVLKPDSSARIFENLDEAIKFGIDTIGKNETLYILPTYTAMLNVRKILTGKKIL